MMLMDVEEQHFTFTSNATFHYSDDIVFAPRVITFTLGV